MKRSIWLGFLFACISCSAQEQDFEQMVSELLSHSVPEVAIDSLDLRTYRLLDAREREEFNASHISGAQWVGYDDFNLSRVSGLDKAAPIVVYCSVGYRSEKVTEQLKKAGYSNVYNLTGGIFDWVNSGNPVYNSQGFPTDSIHGYDENWSKWLTKGIITF